MTRIPTRTSDLTRRAALAGIAAAGTLALSGAPVAALTVGEARALVDAVVRDINGVINSGKSEAGMIRDFEGICRLKAALRRIGHAAADAAPAQKGDRHPLAGDAESREHAARNMERGKK